MEDISGVLCIEHHAVANAVGAAIAQVSGEVDRIHTGVDREVALDEAGQEATRRAIEAGAEAGSVQMLEVEDIPISYLPGDARRVCVRVVGDIGRVLPPVLLGGAVELGHQPPHRGQP